MLRYPYIVVACGSKEMGLPQYNNTRPNYADFAVLGAGSLYFPNQLLSLAGIVIIFIGCLGFYNFWQCGQKLRRREFLTISELRPTKLPTGFVITVRKSKQFRSR